jgi:uncharacterized membrane protein YqgA involved in biofilm formation
MLGTLINAAAIVAGGLFGLFSKKQPSVPFQNYLKVVLGCVTIVYGFRLVWLGLNGTLLQAAGQCGITLLALIIGRLIGKLLGLQKLSNRLGQSARETIARAATSQRPAWSDGFNACTALFCAAPLATLGAVADGLGGQFQPLLVKAVMEGLAALGFAAIFRWSVVLAALPVLAFQGTIAMLCVTYGQPWLTAHGLLDAVIVVDGLLVVFVALLIFEVRKIELADYLPALAIAPLLTWWWH